MLCHDTRIGGRVQQTLTSDPRKLMQIPPEIRKCVAFIAVKVNEEYKFLGTVFFMAKEVKSVGVHVFAVTAKHILKGLLPFEELHIRLNLKGGGSEWIVTTVSDWSFHPTEENSVDIAVIRFILTERLDHLCFPLNSIATPRILLKHSLNVGRQVFIAGMFSSHRGLQRNIPIIRVGNIAALPEEKIETESFGPIDAYLVELRSSGGLSGSPVFIYFEHQETRPVEIIGRSGRPTTITDRSVSPTFWLLGLIHGHWDISANPDSFFEDSGGLKMNSGIAIVIPIEKVVEVLSHPKIVLEDKRIEDEIQRGNLPVED